MKKLFVPYELALLAKEKGFDEECIAEYFDKRLTFYHNLDDKEEDDMTSECDTIICYKNSTPNHFDKELTVCVPLYQQLVDWFRERYNLTIEVSEWDKKFTGKVKPSGKSVKIQINNCEYYEALTTALTESFKLI